MTGAKAELELKSALLGTGLVQPVSSAFGKGRVEVLLRLVPGQESAWLAVVDKILQLTDSEYRDEHLLVARRYVRRGGRTVFGWFVALHCPAAKDLGPLVEKVVAILAEARPQLGVEEPAEPAPAPARPSLPLRPGQHPPPQAFPRAPGAPSSLGAPPGAPPPQIRVVRHDVDEDGRVIVEEEMPLPHVYRDLNKPTHKGGRGAQRTAGSGASRRT